jgi:hypothetical protein
MGYFKWIPKKYLWYERKENIEQIPAVYAHGFCKKAKKR